MHALVELSQVIGGRVEREAYVGLAADAFEPEGEPVPVDGQGLDAHDAVEAVHVDEPGELFDGFGVAVGEMGEQAGFGRGEGIGRGLGEFVEFDADAAGDASGVRRGSASARTVRRRVRVTRTATGAP